MKYAHLAPSTMPNAVEMLKAVELKELTELANQVSTEFEK